MVPRVIQFGTFQAHLDSGELYRDGIKLKLGGQPFQVLTFLLSRPGEVVTREALQSALWQSDTFVDFDHGLNAAINKIREALGDSAGNPRFVETIPRRGYRFIAPVDRPVLAPPEPPPPPSPAASRKWIPLAAGVAAVAIAFIALAIFRSRPPARADYNLTQITRDSGLTWQPSISADGNFVAYASDRATGKDLDIWIQHASGSQPVRLTSTAVDESHPSLSADGKTVVFHIGNSDRRGGVLGVPALGGTARLLSPDGWLPRISPDGTSVAYTTGWYDFASEIRVVPVSGGPARTVSTGLDWAVLPSWTPDGKLLLFWSGDSKKSPPIPFDFRTVPASGGMAMRTGIEDRLQALGAQALPEGGAGGPVATHVPLASVGAGEVVVAARAGDGTDLWILTLPGSGSGLPPVRITTGAEAAHPSIASTGRIAFSRLSVNPGLWVLPINTSSGRVTGEMRRVWRENVSVAFPNLSGDGRKLAYVSNRAGDPDVWARDLDTGLDRQLTSTKADERRAVISPDGSRVAYAVQRDFYTMPSAGGVANQACKNCGDSVVEWSPDGGRLLYYWGNPVRHAILDLGTGQKRDVVWHPSKSIYNGRISPDGLWIAFHVVVPGKSEVYVARLDDGGKPETWIRVSDHVRARNCFWSPDGGLLYIHESDTLWARRLHPRTKTPAGDTFLVHRFEGTGPGFPRTAPRRIRCTLPSRKRCRTSGSPIR